MGILCGFATRPCCDQPPCGDGWLRELQGNIVRVMVADGIGHGIHAHRIVQSLQIQLSWICKRSHPLIDLNACMADLHRCLQEQGQEAQAAVALADLNAEEQWMHALVVGNIEVHCHNRDDSHHVPSLRGMVGGRFPGHLPVTHVPIGSRTLVGLYSDGLDAAPTRDQLTRLHDKGRRHNLDIQAEAEAMVRRFGKPNDDAICALLHLQGVEP